MKTRVSILMLGSFALVSSYIILLVGDFVPRFYEVAYKATLSEVTNVIMLAPTRFASQHAWVFALGILLVVVAGIVVLKRRPVNVLPVTVVALCVQGALVWSAMFCFCYGGFCGAMSLHHGPAFDPVEFVSFEAGVFPITLVALSAPVIAMCINRQKPGAAEPVTPHPSRI